MTRTRALKRFALIAGALLVGASGAHAQPRVLASNGAVLSKACWPEQLLVGRDTAFATIPCNSLEVLPDGMRVQVQCTLDRMAKGKWPTKVYETVRSNRRQGELFKYGRTKPGRRVTNVPTAELGMHHWGFGVDIIHATKYWNASPQYWYWLGQHAEACGLIAGAFWIKFPDRPHLQFAAWEGRPPAWAIALMRAGMIDSLHRRSGATR